MNKFLVSSPPSTYLSAPSFAFAFAMAGCLLVVIQPLGAQDTISFEKAVRPILKAHCFQCHGEEEKLEGGLDVRLVRLMLAGGDSGKVLEPGAVDASLLWQRIRDDEMPEGAKKLTAHQKEVIRQWIEQGAKTSRAEPENPSDARITEEELEYWAFRPVSNPALPRPIHKQQEEHNPIDAFIVKKLSEKGLSFSPPADRATLLRRVTFDLTGLPPTSDEIDAFLHDEEEDAYEQVVDRLLASPEFGVRWGRAWLDVAGYADSDGGTGSDRFRPYAWRYRDYVVGSLNRDIPYRQFVLEQLAGDQLIEGIPDPDNDEHVRLLSATGFLQMAPDVTEQVDTLMDRNQAVADVIKVVGSSLLGLSVGCAQCHDHRYDPITIEDYYRFRAIFDRALPIQHWQKPSSRVIDMTSSVDRAEADRIEAEAVKMDQDIQSRKEVLAKQIQDRELMKCPEDIREEVRAAILLEPGKQDETQKALLEKYPSVRTTAAIIGQLVEFDNPSYRKFQEEEKKVALFRATKPPPRMIMAVRDQESSKVESRVYFRGDPNQPKGVVGPGEIFVLARNRNVQFESNDSSRSPRLQYAHHLTDGSHPLLARVAVNRMWLHHFGRGLVGTPSDFGLFGDRPSHPELLDWLSTELMKSDWNGKAMHRLMVTSRTYRQSSLRTTVLERLDPENRLWGRMMVRRMEAEAIRDALLSVTGNLNHQVVGASIPVSEDGEGKAVVGIRKLQDGLFAGVESVGDQEYRRSLFLESKRLLPMNMLETFDLPAMNPNCDLRRSSTVATQSLWFMNDESMVRWCSEYGSRVYGNGSLPADAAVAQVYRDLLGRVPTSNELEQGIRFIHEQSERFQKSIDSALQERLAKDSLVSQKEAIANLCQALLASNYFLYLD